MTHEEKLGILSPNDSTKEETDMKVSELIEKLREFPHDSDIVVEYPESGCHSFQDYTIEGDITGFDNLDAAKYLVIKVK